ncbi:DEAD/DEAH box helicase [Horticoccus sp. 23ND18S-11]|uniref:DEAD/DEAH box helicase n=1 Tax=Horticoccus sp. 23ND18S-11 TaxID=3391832 RepID=UPI0039C9286E
MPFSALGLSEPLLRAIAERKYSAPTPIQASAIPAILHGRDVWASAQTGSGKTAAFALPLLQRLSAAPRRPGRFTRALILVPTRELAAQIGESLRRYARFLPEPLKTLVVYGGVSINPQMMALGGGADVLVATPGRLIDLLEHNAVSLSAVSHLVLDEADRLLDLGFSAELGRIVALLPEQRQSLLFSATFPAAVEALATGLLRNPARLDVPAAPATQPDIAQRAIEVDAPRRTQLLRQLVEDAKWPSVLVFVATKYATEHVADKLRRAGLNADALHGELSQGARTDALADFKAGRTQILVATDLAARGIDIAKLPVVVNFDLPRSADDYTHRIGRTGRAGETGIAINFISAETHAHFRLIEKRHGLSLPREQIAGFEPIQTEVPAPPTGGIKGKRPNKKDKLRAAAEAQSARVPRF